MASFCRIAVLWICCSLFLQAASRWMEVDRGPFRVLSDGDLSAARIRLGELEQFRYAFGRITGIDEPRLVWPLEVILSKRPAQPPALSRNSVIASIPDSGPLSPEFLEKLSGLFIDDNLKRLPPGFDAGIMALFSTFSSKATMIHIGAPPAPSERTRAWGLLQMLVTDENTRGEVHVFLYDLQQGADLNTASRAAFEQSYRTLNERLSRYLQAGSFASAEFSGAPINPKRDFRADPLDSNDAGLAEADLALASGASDAADLYRALHGPEAQAGAGLATLRRGRKDDARKSLSDAVTQETKSARAWLEMGIFETNPSRKHADFVRAAELNPRWAEPHYQMAMAAKNPVNRIAFLQKAVALEPRNLAWWRKLAETATSAGDFASAAKAWTGASLAAQSDAERAELQKARDNMEERRSDAIEAARKRQEEEEAAEQERVKQNTLSEIRAAENQANKSLEQKGTISNPVPYSELDRPGPKFEGRLLNLDCRGSSAIMSIEGGSPKKLVKFLVGDPSSLTVEDSNTAIACGPQRNPRTIIVEYQPKANRKLGTMGEVRTVQFP